MSSSCCSSTGGRPCNHAATRCLFNSRGASDSLHRQSRGHSCCTTETGTMLRAGFIMAAVKGFFDAFCVFFSRSSGCPGVERQFSEPSSTHTCECSRAPAQFHAQSLWTYAFRLKDRVKNNNNNNNNTIWVGSVLIGEEPPPHSGELKHALPQEGGPTQSQLSRPMSSGHYISMEHRLRRKQSNSDTNASNKKYLKRNTRKMKRRNFFFGKKGKMKNIKKSKNEEMNKK